MRIKLTPEQHLDATRMAAEPDLPNFSKPGTGKTHTALEAIRLFGAKRNLILGPKISISWWAEQAAEYLGAEVGVMKTAASPLVGDIVITTYDIARNARERLYEEFRSGTLTLDESHYVSGVDAKRTQAVFGNRVDLVGGLAERFDTVWCMSGSPMQNYANDYYTQAAALHPEIFSNYGIETYDDFCRKFTYKAKRQFHPRMQPVWKIVSSANEALLHRIVYDELGAICRLEAPNLPDLRSRQLTVPVKVTKELRDACKGLSEEEIARRLGDQNGIIAKAWHQIGLAKVAEVVPYVGDSVRSSPVLLGCWHRDVMEAYAKHCIDMNLKVDQVHGGTPDAKKDRIRNAFNKGYIDVLIGQMSAMGVSWNIQEECHHVIIAEVHPSPAVIDQFYKRVYRRGQERDCTVDLILGDHPIDQALNRVRLGKEKSDGRITHGETERPRRYRAQYGAR